MTFNQVLDRLEKEFFIEARPDTAAFYILPDGRFLYTVDFYGGMSTDDHGNLYYFLVDDLGFDKEEAVDYFKRNGCITCNLDYSIAYIVLPEKITYSQREALYKCVDLLIREKDITKQVEVTTFPYKNRLLITDFVELYDIFKKYYLSGRLPSRFGEDLKLHKTLNPVLWTDDNKLRSSVNNKIRKIVKLFKDELKEWGIDLIIKDIVIVGSNASYNYTSNSDIDVHIVADIDKLNCNQRHLQIIYDLFKTNFNNKYDIDFHNISVELYVEDYNKPAKSNGRYSIISNKWLSLPSVDKIPDVDERRVDKLFKKWEDRYFDLLNKLGESKKEEDIKLDEVTQITDIKEAIKKFYVCGILLENIVDNSRLQPVPNDYKIIEIQSFKNKIKNVKNELEDNEIEIYIKTNPPEASYGGGLYKIRFTPKSSNRSKRGHLRILYGRVDSLKICILMSVLEKQEKENFTDSEINSFKIMLTSFRR